MATDHFSDDDLLNLRPALMAFARSFVRTPTDAEDLVQETILRALTYRHQFAPGTKLKSWLFTIMRNSFYNEAARTRREHPGLEDCVSDKRVIHAPQESACRLYEVRERIRELPREFQDTLLLVAMGESCEHVASQCGCAVGTVKSRVSRARRLLVNDQ